MNGHILNTNITTHIIRTICQDHDYLRLMFGLYDGGYVITDEYKYYSL